MEGLHRQVFAVGFVCTRNTIVFVKVDLRRLAADWNKISCLVVGSVLLGSLTSFQAGHEVYL